MPSLWPAIPADGTMTTNQSELLELIAALRTHFEKVQEMTAWLELKQSELRPDDEFSFLGMLEAKQNLTIEQSLLSGHAFMIQEDIQERHIVLSRDDKKVLETIVAYSQRLHLV